MRRCSALLALLPLAACGGGGAVLAPVQAPARLAAADVTIPAGANSTEVFVELAGAPNPPIRLLQVGVELPAGLELAANERLRAAVPLVTLDGDFVGDRFVVSCGDAQNAAAAPLATGPLFRLRLQTTTPRQPGTWVVQFTGLRAAAADGAAVPAETTPATVTVRIL